jgi:hypothetical protein
VEHLQEHFVDPCVIRNATYMPPQRQGISMEERLWATAIAKGDLVASGNQVLRNGLGEIGRP